MPSAGHGDQVKTYQEIEGNRFKRSTYLIRTVNCSCSIKMILIIIIMIKIIITCRGRSRTTQQPIPSCMWHYMVVANREYYHKELHNYISI